MSQSPLHRSLYLALATGLTVAMLTWALRDARPTEVWATLRQTRWTWVLVGWLAYLAVFWVRAWRWGTLLAGSCPPGRFRSRLAATFVGYGASSVLPAHAGELVRSALLNRLDRVPIGPSLGTIVVERLLDVAVVFGLLLVAARGLPSNSVVTDALSLVAAAMVGVWLLLLLAVRFPHPILRIVIDLCHRLGQPRLGNWLGQLVGGFLTGLEVLCQPRRTLVALGQALLSWALNGITYWAVLQALAIETVGWKGAFFAQSATALAIALPSSPGYIGPFEAGLRYALALYDIPVDHAIAYALILRFLMYFTIPIIAAAIILSLGLRTADLTLNQVQTPAQPPTTATAHRPGSSPHQ